MRARPVFCVVCSDKDRDVFHTCGYVATGCNKEFHKKRFAGEISSILGKICLPILEKMERE